jgi:outer membrane protein W
MLDFAGARSIIPSMKSNPASKLCAALSILLVVGFCSPLHGADGRFFVRLGTGASVPNLKNLNAELALQNREKVGTGYGLGVSLGHTFFEERWSLELHFSTAFYPQFDYNNKYESGFTAKLRHYTSMLVARHNFMSDSERFRPTLGAGIGYGQTNLISGGGKLGAIEGLVTGRLDVSIRSNLELALECSYYAGLQTGEFKADMVQNSAGNALADTFRSLDVRIGLTIWLKPMTK